MNKITELSEQEIYALTTDQVELMIKLRKAEEGIKLVEKPKAPDYFTIAEPDKLVYSCDLFGDELVFESIEELNSVILAIKNSETKKKANYDWNKADNTKKFIQTELKSGYSSQWHTTTSQRVYSPELYNQMIDMISQNKKLKEQYEKEQKTYETAINDAKWIENEINDKVSEVRSKFWKLEEYCRKFKFDYLPLADQNHDVAMKFMDKAYSLTDEQKEYILTNYQTQQ